MKSTIIYLLGHYAVGKLTIGRIIASQTNARLFDNHLANNVIFSIIGADGRTPLPDRVWEMIDGIRDQAFQAIEELTPREVSFVLTNCLLETDPGDRAAYEHVEQLAARRSSVFVPVLLTASDAAHAARINSQERRERFKMTDAVLAEQKRRTTELLHVDHPNRLDLDTTDLSSLEAAKKIIAHAQRCG
ncbi:MAG: hypothetical protein AAF724_00815 [Pseudomonadota bacterium]